MHSKLHISRFRAVCELLRIIGEQLLPGLVFEVFLYECLFVMLCPSHILTSVTFHN